MGVEVLTDPAVLLPVGGRWDITVAVTDDDGWPVAATPTVTLTLPGGTTATPAVADLGGGVYRVVYEVATTGRWVGRVVAAGYGAADVAAYVAATTAGTAMPTADDVAVYLGASAAGWTTEDMAAALEAEAAAQRAVCRVAAVYPADLREALLRRVHRNLAMRQLPLAVPAGDADGSAGVLPGRDPEVRRLEGPHRRVTVG